MPTRRRKTAPLAALILAAGALAAWTPVLSAQAPAPAAVPPRFEAAHDFILRAMRERGLPSVAVAVARDGEVLWEAAFGWADRERRIPATPHTLYSLASISKPITATALMVLAERGVVSLDRPANDYLGAARIRDGAGPAAGATVRRLLGHTAGLPLHYRFFYADDPHPPVAEDEATVRYGVTVNPPGEVYEYSNLGYGILGRIIELASGDGYADFVRREVFAPLGMTRASIHLTPALEPFAAVRYDGDAAPIPWYGFDHDGASAAWASAHDLIRFALFHLGHVPADARPILADTTVRLMQRAVTPGPEDDGYGLGWFVEPDDHGLRAIWHSGSMPGVSTMLRLYPSEDVAVVVLLNTLDRTMRLRIAQELVAAVVPAYAQALEAGRAAARAEARGQEREDRAWETAPPELAGVWTGTVRTHERAVPIRLDFRDGGDVHVRLDGQLETVLNGVAWRDGRLLGRFAGRIPTEDAARHDHTVRLDLRLRDGRLSGQATAQASAPRVYFSLGSYTELTRETAVSAAGRGAGEVGESP